ncbi:hypothetical protein BVX97_02250 [bacterium E08(2017)]|nr:hypothetical protein BVX97_02250 [bacterium E08(2017)]
MSGNKDNGLILLTGATGYIGGCLLGKLVGRGENIRCLVRNQDRMQNDTPADVEIVQGDVLDEQTLTEAMKAVSVAYYLVHSMGSKGDFEELDRKAAKKFAAVAKEAGVNKIIYLGGLGNEEDGLSDHLRSRQEIGKILLESGAAVIEFRASIVIGSGSLSFEMIRALVERLPVMITPKWVSVKAQPIYIDDLIEYLLGALDMDCDDSRVYEIGGADCVSYCDLMKCYASCRGKKLRMLPVPVLTPYLSSLWLGLVTPLYARVGRRLIEGVLYSTVVRNDAAARDFDIRPIGVTEAVSKCLNL